MHIFIRYHYTRDLIQQEKIKLKYKKTQKMIADGLTMPLGPVAFKKFMDLLGLTSVDMAVLTAKNRRQIGVLSETLYF